MGRKKGIWGVRIGQNHVQSRSVTHDVLRVVTSADLQMPGGGIQNEETASLKPQRQKEYCHIILSEQERAMGRAVTEVRDTNVCLGPG